MFITGFDDNAHSGTYNDSYQEQKFSNSQGPR